MRSSTQQVRRGKVVAAAALFAATTLALSACGSSATPSQGGGVIEDGPATGTIEIWVQGGEAATLPEMFDAFTDANPDVEFSFTEVPEEEFLTKMTAAIAAGSVPDLIFGYSQTDASLIATEGFAQVPDGLVEEEAFFESMWQMSVLDDVAYGVPWYANANGSYYRSDLAEAAGVDIPETWDELVTFGQALKDQGAQVPIAISIDWGTYTAGMLEVWSHQNGGGFLSDDHQEWTINDDANVKTFEFLGKLMKEGLSSPDAPNYLDLIPSVSEGRTTGIYDIGTFLRGFLAEANGPEWFDEHMTFVPNPIPNGGTEGAGFSGGTWFVPVDAKNSTAAWKFVQYMSEPETQVEWFTTFGSLPAVKAAWDDPAFEDDEFLAVAKDGIENGIPTPNVPTWPEVGAIIGAAAEKVARGTATAQEALDEAQQRAEAIGVE